MITTYTPGPWTASEQFDDDESLGIAVSAGRQEIVRIHDIGREGFANAALIAAAPDMLAALHRAAGALASVSYSDPSIESAYSTVLAAIARATQE